MKRSTNSLDQAIAIAALRLLAVGKWDELTLPRIAKSAKLSVSDVTKQVRDIYGVLSAINGYVKTEVENSCRSLSGDDTREHLFEIMMAHFDVLQKHRAAFLKMIKAARTDPKFLSTILRAQSASLRSTLKLAKIDQGPLVQRGSLIGLASIYASTLCVWQRDETLDMSKTMVALDRALRWADRLARVLSRFA